MSFKQKINLNGRNMGISKIELNECDLLVTDKSQKYCFKVCVKYNWKDINTIKIGEKKKIDFNECCLSENNESALIWTSNCYVEKISDDVVYFYFEFKDLANTIHYMNKRECFDIDVNSLEVKIYINYKDEIEGSIIYNI